MQEIDFDERTKEFIDKHKALLSELDIDIFNSLDINPIAFIDRCKENEDFFIIALVLSLVDNNLDVIARSPKNRHSYTIGLQYKNYSDDVYDLFDSWDLDELNLEDYKANPKEYIHAMFEEYLDFDLGIPLDLSKMLSKSFKFDKDFNTNR